MGRDITGCSSDHARVWASGAATSAPTSSCPSRCSRTAASPRSRARRMRCASSIAPKASRGQLGGRRKPWIAGLTLGARGRVAGALARRTAPARDRHGAWPPTPRCCCSTSRWPAWGSTNRAHGGTAQAPEARPRHPAGGARHGRGVRGGRHDHGDGQRAGAGVRNARADRPAWPCSRPIWAGGHASMSNTAARSQAGCTPTTAPATSCTASTFTSARAKPSA
jgi:hypothetical protein